MSSEESSLPPKIPEEEVEKILHRAAQLYAEHNSEVSLEYLITTGKEADIPKEFTIQACKEFVEQEKQDKSHQIKKEHSAKQLIFWILISFAMITTCTGFFIWRTSNICRTSKSNNDSYYVYSIKPTLSNKMQEFYDGNPIFYITVYEKGNSGHVTELECMRPPDTIISEVKRINRGGMNAHGQYFCNPL